MTSNEATILGATLSDDARLGELVEALRHQTLADLIFQSVVIETDGQDEQVRERRLRAAFAAAFAAAKIPLYLAELDDVNDLRLALGHQIHDLIEPGIPTPTDPDERIALIACNAVAASHLMGRQEVALHRFSVCVAQIERLLPFVLKACGIKLAAEDAAFLASFDTLRDQFEHLDARLPTPGRGSGRPPKGQDPQTWLVTQLGTGPDWEMRMEMPSDAEGNILVAGKPVAVPSKGHERVRRICADVYDRAGAARLEDFRQSFASRMDQVPSVDIIDKTGIGQLPEIRFLDRSSDDQAPNRR